MFNLAADVSTLAVNVSSLAANVSTFGPDVSTFAANVFSFWPKVFSFGAEVFSRRRGGIQFGGSRRPDWERLVGTREASRCAVRALCPVRIPGQDTSVRHTWCP